MLGHNKRWRGLRACMHTLKPGDVIERESDTRINFPAFSAPKIERINENSDIIIIGAGPAGLNAAITAKQCGAEVIVVDERTDTGGQYFKPRSPGFRGFRKLDRQHREGIEVYDKKQSNSVFRFIVVKQSGTLGKKKTKLGLFLKNNKFAQNHVRSLFAPAHSKFQNRTRLDFTGSYDNPAAQTMARHME